MQCGLSYPPAMKRRIFMISVTTPSLENGVIIEYKGIVTGEVVAGINFLKDFGASIRILLAGAPQVMRRKSSPQKMMP